VGFPQAVDTQAVEPLVHFAKHTRPKNLHLGRSDLAFKEGLLDSLAKRLARVSHPAEASLTPGRCG
jgi:hypothetical protein